MALYNMERFPEAADLFRQAIIEDSLYLYPHYNLACCLSIVYGQGDLSVGQELFDELALCIGLDELIRDKMAVDNDFDAVRENERFAALMEGSPVILSAKELWAGEWHSSYCGGEGTLILNPDETFSFNTTCSEHSQYTETSGTWQLSGSDSRLVLSPKSDFLFGCKDCCPDNPRTKKALVVEQDQAVFEIRFYETADSTHPLAVFAKGESALSRALSDMDFAVTAGLLLHGYDPGLGSAMGKSPFLMVLESERPALIRLFLGCKGVIPGEREFRFMTNSPRFGQLYKGYLDREAQELLTEISGLSLLDQGQYRRLLFEPIVKPHTPEGISIESNQLFFLGSTDNFVAFLESEPGMNGYGTQWKISVFNVSENRFVDTYIVCFLHQSQVDKPWVFLRDDDLLVWYLMKTDREWVSLLEKYGIKPIQTPPRISSLPVSLGPESIDLRITLLPESQGTSDYDESMLEKSGRLGWEIIKDGSRYYSPFASFQSVTPLGGFVINGDSFAAVVFVHSTRWLSFEEFQSNVQVIGVVSDK
jgi:hypothetical protein